MDHKKASSEVLLPPETFPSPAALLRRGLSPPNNRRSIAALRRDVLAELFLQVIQSIQPGRWSMQLTKQY